MDSKEQITHLGDWDLKFSVDIQATDSRMGEVLPWTADEH